MYQRDLGEAHGWRRLGCTYRDLSRAPQGKTLEEAGELALLHAFIDSDVGTGNGDGVLSLDEWVRGMSAIGEKCADAEFEAEMDETVKALKRTVTLRSVRVR